MHWPPAHCALLPSALPGYCGVVLKSVLSLRPLQPMDLCQQLRQEVAWHPAVPALACLHNKPTPATKCTFKEEAAAELWQASRPAIFELQDKQP